MSPAHRIQAFMEHNLQSMDQHNRISRDGFTLYAHNTDSSFDENIVFPTPDSAAAVGRLDAAAHIRALCEEYKRQPYVIFLDQAAPALEPHLTAAGFACEKAPVLLATQASAHELPALADVTVDMLTQDSPLDAIRANLDVNAMGFDPGAAPATDDDARQFCAGLGASRAFTLRYQGQAVAAGMYLPIHEGVTELVGIATLEAFRRHGFARYLTNVMARAAFAVGAELVFLTATSAESAQVYVQAGFAPFAEQVACRLASA